MEFSSLFWVVPFLGIILSMSFLPLLFPRFWEERSFFIMLFWVGLYLVFISCFFGIDKIIYAALKPIIGEYISFIVLIFSLYVVSGGIFLNFQGYHGPIFNTIFLFLGSILAGWIGTTGAAALLIRPFLRANMRRKHNTHLVVFFIFLLANVGGAATPLGDPPLFIGFLNGVDFFWFIKNLYKILFSTIIVLCFIFFLIDSYFYRNDHLLVEEDEKPNVEIKGRLNMLLITLILLVVVFSSFNRSFIFAGEKYSISALVRNIVLLLIAFISLKFTSKDVRQKNHFSLEPIKEVAELFAGIFVTVAPIINMLHQGVNGSFGKLFSIIAPNGEFAASKCFWISGLLSSILDNAPTFLIFFHLTSGDANILMATKANILTAFSVSTVFMGALTYIGNAPNLIVRSVSTNYKMKVPSFLGYIAWSSSILLPIFAIIAYFL